MRSAVEWHLPVGARVPAALQALGRGVERRQPGAELGAPPLRLHDRGTDGKFAREAAREVAGRGRRRVGRDGVDRIHAAEDAPVVAVEVRHHRRRVRDAMAGALGHPVLVGLELRDVLGVAIGRPRRQRVDHVRVPVEDAVDGGGGERRAHLARVAAEVLVELLPHADEVVLGVPGLKARHGGARRQARIGERHRLQHLAHRRPGDRAARRHRAVELVLARAQRRVRRIGRGHAEDLAVGGVDVLLVAAGGGTRRGVARRQRRQEEADEEGAAHVATAAARCRWRPGARRWCWCRARGSRASRRSGSADRARTGPGSCG